MRQIIPLFALFSLSLGTRVGVQATPDQQQPEDMNVKIQTIAKGIVDKWIAEGLTVTRDKVEGWIDVLDKSRTKGRAKNKAAAKKPIEKTAEQEFGKEFTQVRDSLVETFSNIGKVKCENCKKTKPVRSVESRSVEEDDQSLNEGIDKRLEELSVDELKKQQATLKRLMQMEKMSKLANLAGGLSQLSQLKDAVDSLKKLTTPREEL